MGYESKLYFVTRCEGCEDYRNEGYFISITEAMFDIGKLGNSPEAKHFIRIGYTAYTGDIKRGAKAMIKFYDTEYGETITLAELMTEYDTLKAEEATEAEDFGAYLRNCLTENNGTLEVIL